MVTYLIRASLWELCSSTTRDWPCWGEVTVARILELFLTPNCVRVRVWLSSLRILPAQMRLMKWGLSQLDRFATSSRNEEMVQFSKSTSSNTPDHVPAIFNFAMLRSLHSTPLDSVDWWLFLFFSSSDILNGEVSFVKMVFIRGNGFFFSEVEDPLVTENKLGSKLTFLVW